MILKKYLDIELGNTKNEKEKCFGLAQSHALDGFLHRSVRWNWLFDTDDNTVMKNWIVR
jgi:hypothetical protein